MKQHSEIRSLFLPWIEEKLDPQAAEELKDHLNGCGSCRLFFETMSAAMLPSTSMQVGLVVDPYVPVRIRARAKASMESSDRKLVVRWALRTVVFASAILFGVYMGEKLSYQAGIISDQRIISEYSTYLGESGIGERWQDVALLNEGVSK